MLLKFKHCESCGFPMLKPEDFGGKVEGNKRCRNCCDESGEFLSFEDVLRGHAVMLLHEGKELTGIEYKSLDEALVDAKEYLLRQPAWKKS